MLPVLQGLGDAYGF